MLVEAENIAEAEDISKQHIPENVDCTQLSFEHITSITQLKNNEQYSKPWRSTDRQKEFFSTVEDILDPLPVTQREIPPEGISKIELHKID